MANAHSIECLALGCTAVGIPLTLTAVAIGLSPWFNVLDNALSDLGHATRSSVAPIFNLGLSLGGFLMGIHAAGYGERHSRVLAWEVIFTGFSMLLIGVFDEVYDRFLHLHFWVSAIFFSSLAVFLVTYTVLKRTPLPTISLVIEVTTWLLHLSWRMPRGAAVPELVSIAATLPFYLAYVAEIAKLPVEKVRTPTSATAKPVEFLEAPST